MPLVVNTLTVLFVVGLATCEAALIALHAGRPWGITVREAWILAVPAVACLVPCLSNVYALVVERQHLSWSRRIGHASRALGVLLMLAGILPAAMSLEARLWAWPSAALIVAGYALVLASMVLLLPTSRMKS